jgi:enduracididine beta-hydroxylase
MPNSTRLIQEPAVFALDDHEMADAAGLIARLLAAHPTAQGAGFLRAVTLHSHELPERLRSFLLAMRAQETVAGFVVSGFPVDDGAIGPTPHGWGLQADPGSTTAETTWLALCGSVLGELFGWATQQDGAVVHDIAPARADERSQVGSSSSELLWWHTEEAFHPLKCDYLGLMCLRNRDQVATTFSSMQGIELDAEVRKVLFEQRFLILPDDSHLAQRPGRAWPGGKEGELLTAAQKRIDQMNRSPQRVALLYGDFYSPYLSIDPFYMQVSAEDPLAQQAFGTLCDALESGLREVVLAPGDILFIDNYRAVHGRKPFRARYDGTDRWLKRINITRDLRKSRAYRMTSDSRIIY